MDNKTKMILWREIINTPEEKNVNYEGIIRIFFSNCEKENIFNIADEYGNTPLLLAKRAENKALVETILKHRESSPNKLLGYSWDLPLNSLATKIEPLSKEGFIDLLEDLSIKNLQNLSIDNPSSENARQQLNYLHNACLDDFEGKDIFSKDYTCFRESPLFVRLFLFHQGGGAAKYAHLFIDQINQQIKPNEDTSLMRAIGLKGRNNLALVSKIIENGADLTLKNSFGKTALDIARETKGAEQIVTLLEQKMSNIVSNSSLSISVNNMSVMNVESSAAAGSFVERLENNSAAQKNNSAKRSSEREIAENPKKIQVIDLTGDSVSPKSSWQNMAKNQQNHNSSSQGNAK